MKTNFGILLILGLILLVSFSSCKKEKTHPIEMIAVPSLELLSDKTIGNSSQKIKISLESFYISDEITNKEYREFTDWVKNNPDQILSRSREIIGSKKDEFGKSKVWLVPVFIGTTELLPKVIDSNALYKLDKRFKNYFTDEKYDDYPVVGVSRNNAEYFCFWKTSFEWETKTIGHGKSKIYTMRSPDTQFRLPEEIEWEYVAKQQLKRRLSNDHSIHQVFDGNTNKWGLSHLYDNVSEWVIADDSSAISRGGSWKTDSNISDRQILNPDSCNGYTGFRIVRTYKPVEINKRQERK